MHKKILLADARYASLLERYWGSEYTILKSVKCAELPEPVSYHPDMVLFPLGYHSFLCAPNVYSAYQSLLAPYGIKLVQGKRFLSGNYPKDIASEPFCLETKKMPTQKFWNMPGRAGMFL
mgnify:CR=1 FL=1